MCKYWAWDTCCWCCMREISLLLVWQEVQGRVGSQTFWDDLLKESYSCSSKTPENVTQNTRIWLHYQVQTWHRNASRWPNVKTKPSTKWRVIGPSESMPSAILWWKDECFEARHLLRSWTFSSTRNHLLWLAWKTETSSSAIEEVMGLPWRVIYWKRSGTQGRNSDYSRITKRRYLREDKLLVLIYSHGMGTNICLCQGRPTSIFGKYLFGRRFEI